MTDIEKLIKLLEHAESFSLEAYGKSPNLSECSRQFYYLHDCILQAIDNAKALRERLANDKTDKEIMQQALKALEVLTDNYDDNAVGIEIDAIIALRKRLAQPDPLQRLTDVQQEIEAALAPERELPWLRAIDEAMIVHHIGVADPADDYETAKRKVNNLLCHAQDIGAYFAKQAEPEQEPVAGVVIREGLPTLLQDKHIKSTDQRLYATPQKREWQGLTDEEIMHLDMETSGTVIDFVHAVEAKLKEKND